MRHSISAGMADDTRGPTVRDAVDRVLAGSAGHYKQLDRFRSRRSGRVVFVEIVLSFEPGLTIAEVNRRIAALKQSMAQEIEHADISILTTGATTA
jgi:divalent metal cation (Fe/Co/Zn/Cd) transporter